MDGPRHKTLEGLRDRKYFKWMKSPHDILHRNKWIMLHDLLYIGLDLSKRGVRNVKLESGNLLQWPLAPRNIFSVMLET
jgi:hypothetical protein